MKLVYLTSGESGSGHIRHAQALRSVMARAASLNRIDLEQVICEVVPDGAPLVALPRLYGPLVRAAPSLWGLLYGVTNSRRRHSLIAKALAASLAPRILTVLREANPDLIITVYPHINEAVHRARLEMQRLCNRPVPLLIAVTDAYSTHAAWLAGAADGVLVGSESARRDCMQLGIPGDAVHVTGIPVDTSFTDLHLANVRSGQALRRSLREKAGMPDDAYVALVSGGGPGAGDMERIIGLLARYPFGFKLHLIVVAGRNASLRSRIRRLGLMRDGCITVREYADNMHELMLISDVVIGKAGPMTVLEALTMRKPLMLTSCLPGQERANADFVQRSGAGLCCFERRSIPGALQRIHDRQAEIANTIDALVRDSPELGRADELTANVIFRTFGLRQRVATTTLAPC